MKTREGTCELEKIKNRTMKPHYSIVVIPIRGRSHSPNITFDLFDSFNVQQSVFLGFSKLYPLWGNLGQTCFESTFIIVTLISSYEGNLN